MIDPGMLPLRKARPCGEEIGPVGRSTRMIISYLVLAVAGPVADV